MITLMVKGGSIYADDKDEKYASKSNSLGINKEHLVIVIDLIITLGTYKFPASNSAAIQR